MVFVEANDGWYVRKCLITNLVMVTIVVYDIVAHFIVFTRNKPHGTVTKVLKIYKVE